MNKGSLKLVYKICCIGACLLPASIVLILVFFYGTNVPYWDEWESVSFYKSIFENGFDVSALLQYQNNEHRIIIPLIVQLSIWFITNGNDHIVLLVSNGCLWVAYFIIAIYWIKRNLPMWGILPLAPIIFSFKQGMMYFLPFCIMWTLLVLFVVSSFYFYYLYINKQKWWLFVFTILFAVFSTFCAANGILIWITYLAYFISQKLFENKRFFMLHKLIILAIGILCLLFYFIDWKGPTTQFVAHNGLDLFKSFLMSIGCLLFEQSQAWEAFIFGAIILTILILGVYKILLDKKLSTLCFPVLISIFFLGSILMVAYGRTELGEGVVLNSQYSMMPAWFLVSIYLLFIEYLFLKFDGLSNFKFSKYSVALYLFLLFISIGKYNVTREWINNLQSCAYTVQHYNDVPDKMKTMYVYPAVISDRVSWIQAKNLFLFNDSIQYKYPYNDFSIAERLNININKPMNLIEHGTFNVDSISGSTVYGEIKITQNSGFDINLWALDSANSRVPSDVIIEFAGEYYRLNQIPRPDVAAVYGNEYFDSGFTGYISVFGVAPGKYPINLLAICNGGDEYYTAQIAVINIEAD